MAEDDIVQRIVLSGQVEVIAAFAAIGEAGKKAFEDFKKAEEASSGFGALGNVLAGITVGLATVTGAMFELSRVTSEAVISIGELGRSAGTTVENISLLTGAMTEAGASTDQLTSGFRHASFVIEQEWAVIKKAVNDGAITLQQDYLSINQAIVALEKAQFALSTSSRDAALLQISNSVAVTAARQAEAAAAEQAADTEKQNALSVGSAEISLAEARYKLNLLNGGQRDLDFEQRIAHSRAVQAVEEAELRLQEAKEKKERDAAEAANRAQQAALARAEAEKKAADDAAQAAAKQREIELSAQAASLALTAARKKAREDESNDVATLTKYVQDLSKGLDVSSSKANVTAENLVKGLISSVGPSIEALKGLGGEISHLGDSGPKVVDVFGQMAELFSHIESNALKSAIATRILGRSVSQATIDFLSGGRGAVEAEAARLEKLGLFITEPMEHAAQAFHNAQGRLSRDVEIIAQQFATPFQEAFTPILKAIATAFENNRATIVSWGEYLAGQASAIVTSFIQKLDEIPTSVKTQWIQDFVEGLKSLGTAMLTVARIVEGAINVFVGIAEVIRNVINATFGTNLKTAEVAVGLFIAGLLGGFSFLKNIVVGIAAEIGAAMAGTVVAAETAATGVNAAIASMIPGLRLALGLFALFKTIEPTDAGKGSAPVDAQVNELKKLTVDRGKADADFQENLKKLQNAQGSGDTTADDQIKTLFTNKANLDAEFDAREKKIKDSIANVGTAAKDAGKDIVDSHKDAATGIDKVNEAVDKSKKLFKDLGIEATATGGQIKSIPSPKIEGEGTVTIFRGMKKEVIDLKQATEEMNKSLRETGSFQRPGPNQPKIVASQSFRQQLIDEANGAKPPEAIPLPQPRPAEAGTGEPVQQPSLTVATQTPAAPVPVTVVGPPSPSVTSALGAVSQDSTSHESITFTLVDAITKLIRDQAQSSTPNASGIASVPVSGSAGATTGSDVTTPSPFGTVINSFVDGLGVVAGAITKLGEFAVKSVVPSAGAAEVSGSTSSPTSSAIAPVLEQNRLDDGFSKVSDAVSKVTDSLDTFKQATVDGFSRVSDLVDSFKQSVAGSLQSVVDALSNLLNAVNLNDQAIVNAISDAMGKAAQAIVDALGSLASTINTNEQVAANLLSNILQAIQQSKSAIGKAAGGFISGPGGPTSDSIPAYLSNGEYVVRASSVAQYGKSFFDMINSGIARFADGGWVDSKFKKEYRTNEGLGFRGNASVSDSGGGHAPVNDKFILDTGNEGPILISESLANAAGIQVTGHEQSKGVGGVVTFGTGNGILTIEGVSRATDFSIAPDGGPPNLIGLPWLDLLRDYAISKETFLMQAATGGHIQGPGTGTSDSILARLSNGEFVINAKSVEHFGVDFFAALNSIKSGSQIDVGRAVPPRFALGGLVDGLPSTSSLSDGGSDENVRSLDLAHFGRPIGRVTGRTDVIGELERAAVLENLVNAGDPQWR